MDKFLEEKDKQPEIQNLSKLAKDFVIEKFKGSNSNTFQRIKECEGFQIVDDRKKM